MHTLFLKKDSFSSNQNWSSEQNLVCDQTPGTAISKMGASQVFANHPFSSGVNANGYICPFFFLNRRMFCTMYLTTAQQVSK